MIIFATDNKPQIQISFWN